MTVSALFIAGELEINLGSRDNVAVQENPTSPGSVSIIANGVPLTGLTTIAASSVTKLLINGGDDANRIDLTGMTSAVFNNPALSIEVHAGNGDDTLLGSNDLADSLDAGDGEDSIDGNGGNDTVLAGDGDDTIVGGAGNDSIDAGDGQDSVNGNGGNDTILAGDGNDSVNGAAGDDSLSGDDGADTLLGNDGNDTLNGNSGTDSLNGENGDDSILGGNGNDTIQGGSGADISDGQAGNDAVYAEDVTGQSVVTTSTTSTSIFSTNFDSGVPAEISGATLLAPVQGYAGVGTGTNVFGGNLLHNDTGGTRNNPGSIPQTATTLTLTNLPTHTSLDLNVLLATINSWNGRNPANFGMDFFNVRVDGVLLFRGDFDNVSATGVDQTYSPPAGVQLTPRPLTDLGFPSPSTVFDSAWNLGLDPLFNNIPHTASTLTIDMIADGSGFEGSTSESWGIDNLEVILNGVPVSTTILSSDTLLGGVGNDTLNGADGNDLVNGQAGNDQVIGNNGDDTLYGGAGQDTLHGDSSNPNLIGTGNDSLFGNGGDDSLLGGGGGDVMDGGDGNDVLRSTDFDSVNGVLVSVQDAPSVVESGPGNTTTMTFTVTLDRVASTVVTVGVATAAGSAVSPADFLATAATLVFPIGVTSQTLTVSIVGDDLDESAENLFLNVVSTTGAFALDSQGQGIITDNDGWIAMGPGPGTGGQTENVVPNNEVTGAVHVVAPHPTDPNIGFVGGVNGGIWRTTNLQATSPTWVPVTDQFASLSIGAIAFDATNSNSMVAGIGRHSSYGGDGGNLAGLLRSTDGGLTWAAINNGLLNNQNISGVAVRGNVILASSDTFFGGGVFRSTDSGATFTRLQAASGLGGGVTYDLVGDPSNPSRFYVTVQGQGLFRSDNLGANWVNVSNNDPILNGEMRSFALDNAEMAVSNNGRIYVITVQFGDANYIGYSDNQGATWTAMDMPRTLEVGGVVVGLNPNNRRPENSVPGIDNRPDVFPGGQGAIHLSITADPTNPNIVYVGGDRQDTPFPNSIGANNFSGRLFRGDTTQPRTNAVNSPQWAHLTHSDNVAAIPNGGTANDSSPHADSRDMAFDAAGNLIEGDDGGVYRRTSPRTNSGDWFSINGNLQLTEQHDVAYDTNSNIILSGNQDTGTLQQVSTGSFTWSSVNQADGGDVATDALIGGGQSIRYSSSQFLFGFRRQAYDANNQLQNSTTLPMTVTGGGFIFPQFYTPIATNDVVGSRLIVAGGNGLFESRDQGNTFTAIGAGIVGNSNAIAYGGRRNGVVNPDVLYVGAFNSLFARQAGAGAPTITAYPGGIVTGIAVNPNNFFDVYVSDQSNVWHTTDAGATWASVTGNLGQQVRHAEFVPGRNGTPDVVLVGTNLGVFRMDVNQAGQWREMGDDLPNAPVMEIVYDATDDLLTVGTLGRGAWQFSVASRGDFPSTFAPGIGPQNLVSVGDTMFGSTGNDLIVGADGDDFINADGGNDTVFGGAGNDSILGGSGADHIEGQLGDDTLRGQGGKDTVIGGEGNDVYEWNLVQDGSDTLSSANGDDSVAVTSLGTSDVVAVSKLGSSLKITSGTNELTVNATIRVVTINTGDGDDTVTVGDIAGVLPTVLTIDTGNGDDVIDASAGVLGTVRIRLAGGNGLDSITGSTGDDTIDGGAGNDYLRGGAGNDTMFGGDGSDAVNGQDGDDLVQGDAGNDFVNGGNGNDTARGGLGHDSVNGNAGNDTVEGNDGRDSLFGSFGNDSLDGGVGKDVLSGGEDDDTLDGGRNDDTISGDAGADSIRGNHGNDSIDGGSGSDTINGGDGNDTINSGDDDDLVTGADGDDVISAGAGNDTVTGGDGKDSIYGGAGNDVLLGDDGDDLISGQGGADTLAGNQGADTIIGDLAEIIESFVIPDGLLEKLDLV